MLRHTSRCCGDYCLYKKEDRWFLANIRFDRVEWLRLCNRVASWYFPTRVTCRINLGLILQTDQLRAEPYPPLLVVIWDKHKPHQARALSCSSNIRHITCDRILRRWLQPANYPGYRLCWLHYDGWVYQIGSFALQNPIRTSCSIKCKDIRKIALFVLAELRRMLFGHDFED